MYQMNEYLEAKAAARGCSVEYSGPRVLQLDLDTEEQYQTWLERRPQLERQIERVEEWRSSKRGNRHVQIHLKRDMPAPMRAIWQLYLGSDPKRELSTARRMWGRASRRQDWVLFKPLDARSDAEKKQLADIECKLTQHLWKPLPGRDYGSTEEICMRCGAEQGEAPETWSS